MSNVRPLGMRGTTLMAQSGCVREQQSLPRFEHTDGMRLAYSPSRHGTALCSSMGTETCSKGCRGAARPFGRQRARSGSSRRRMRKRNASRSCRCSPEVRWSFNGCQKSFASSTLSAMSSSHSLSSVAEPSSVSAFHPKRPNPSIEGTSNIWLRQLSAAPHVKR